MRRFAELASSKVLINVNMPMDCELGPRVACAMR